MRELTHVPKAGVVVSTVDLFVTIGGQGFETMVFRADKSGKVTDWLELFCRRYDSEQEALRGHKSVISDCSRNAKSWLKRKPK